MNAQNKQKVVTLDGNYLQTIAQSSGTAKAVLKSLAGRERLRHYSDIARTKAQLLASGAKVVDSEYMQLWKDLQAANVGSIVYGRRGNPSRFEWHYSLKTVADTALTGRNLQAKRLDPNQPVSRAVVSPKAAESAVPLPSKPTKSSAGRARDEEPADDLSEEEIETLVRTLVKLLRGRQSAN